YGRRTVLREQPEPEQRQHVRPAHRGHGGGGEQQQVPGDKLRRRRRRRLAYHGRGNVFETPRWWRRPATAAAAAAQQQQQQQPTTTGSAMMYSADSSTMAEDMFARRLGCGAGRSPSGIGDATAAATAAAVFAGIDEHGGEEARGGRGGRSLRLSPAEPMANAFPAPMTNAFPASTDTPESEPPGRGGSPRRDSDHRKKAAAPLSPSPASSMHLRGPSPAAAASEMMMPMAFVEGE
ncbi:unnamed protein product, partial [Ectocarpus sp. 12 AP-2014]